MKIPILTVAAALSVLMFPSITTAEPVTLEQYSAHGGLLSLGINDAKGQGDIPSVQGKAIASPSAAPALVDLGGLFAGDSRNQMSIGDCHAFATVGVVEAAYNRQYKPDAIRFSEADLFVRFKRGDILIYQNGAPSTPGDFATKEGAGNDERHHEAQFALRDGVASTVPYDQFEKRFRAEFGELSRAADYHTENGFAKDVARENPLTQFVFGVLYGGPAQKWSDDNKEWEKKEFAALSAASNSPQAAAERKVSKDKLAGFSAYYMDFHQGCIDAPAPADLAKAIAPQREVIKAELLANRPVYISVDIGGLAGWEFETGKCAFHATILQGYTTDKDGGLVFHSRNSWGKGKNHDVPERELWRVKGVVTVLTPKEAPSAGKWIKETAQE